MKKINKCLWNCRLKVIQQPGPDHHKYFSPLCCCIKMCIKHLWSTNYFLCRALFFYMGDLRKLLILFNSIMLLSPLPLCICFSFSLSLCLSVFISLPLCMCVSVCVYPWVLNVLFLLHIQGHPVANCLAQSSLYLVIFLTLSPTLWDYGCSPPGLDTVSLFFCVSLAVFEESLAPVSNNQLWRFGRSKWLMIRVGQVQFCFGLF